MELFLQVTSFVLVFGLTYLFFLVVGDRGRGLLVNREKSKEWSRFVSGRFGSALTIANVFATATSLATVYLFFVGSSKLFGYWTFVCCLSIVIGAIVTNWLTNRIRVLDRPKRILGQPTQSGAVIASLFWSKSNADRKLSSAVKYISALTIFSIIWLEFSVFGDITVKVVGGSLQVASVIVFLVTLSVVFFTLKFGLRGFIMADVLHAVIIVVGVLIFLVGVLFVGYQDSRISIGGVIKPMLDPVSLLIFSLHVSVANAFLVVVSESHWLRMWVFENKEVKQQLPAQLGTSLVWAALIAAGLVSATHTNSIDTGNVASMLAELGEKSPVFLLAFWLGASAALFSTADSQIYCLRLVLSFDTSIGSIPDGNSSIRHPVVAALAAASVAAGLYSGVRYFGVPFDKIVFVLLPMTLNLLPPFLQLAFGRTPTLPPVIISLVLYLIFAAMGFMAPASQLGLTLAAALMPVIVGILALVLQSSKQMERGNG